MTATAWSQPNLDIENPQFVITVNWTWPEQTERVWTHFRLVRKKRSPAVRIEEGQTMVEVAFDDILAQEEDIDPQFRDPQPPPGEWIFYSAFVLDDNRIWNYAGAIKELGIADYDWSLRLPELLPGVAVSHEQGVAHPADQSHDLVQFLQSPGAFLDYAVTSAESMQHFWDPEMVPPHFLPALAKSWGYPYNLSLDMSRAREVLAALRLPSQGSLASLQRMASAASGCLTTISISNNLMLDVNDSSFESGDIADTGWSGAGAFGTIYESPVSYSTRAYAENIVDSEGQDNFGAEREQSTSRIYYGRYDDYYDMQRGIVVPDPDFQSRISGYTGGGNGVITKVTLKFKNLWTNDAAGGRLLIYLSDDLSLPDTLPDPIADGFPSAQIDLIPRTGEVTFTLPDAMRDQFHAARSIRFIGVTNVDTDYGYLDGDSIEIEVEVDTENQDILEIRSYASNPDPTPIAPPNVMLSHFLHIQSAGTIKCGGNPLDPLTRGIPVSTWDRVRMGCYATSTGSATLRMGMDLHDSSGAYLESMEVLSTRTTTNLWRWYGNGDEDDPIPEGDDTAIPIELTFPVLEPADTLTNPALWTPVEKAGDIEYAWPQGAAPVFDVDGIRILWSSAPADNQPTAFFGVTVSGLAVGAVYSFQLAVESTPTDAPYRATVAGHENPLRYTDPAVTDLSPSLDISILDWRATSESAEFGIEVARPSDEWTDVGTHKVVGFSVTRAETAHAYGVPWVEVGDACSVDLIVVDDG